MGTITSDLHIEGMSCRHCVAAVEGALTQINSLDVEEISIGKARVRYESSVSSGAITEAIEEAGYTVQSVEQVS